VGVWARFLWFFRAGGTVGRQSAASRCSLARASAAPLQAQA